MQKILVPFDFSAYSEFALDFAYDYALNTKGQIKLLHVVSHSAYGGVSAAGEMPGLINYEQEFVTDLVKRSNEKLEALVDQEKFKKISIDFEVKVGAPFNNIIDEITSFEADLIIMGTKGATGLEEFFIGSNAEKVVRFAKCPVITIPKWTDFNMINDIAFAINFEEEQKYVVELLKSYQKIFGAKLHLVWINTLHVIDNDDIVEHRLNNFIAENMIENFETHVVKAITPEHGILSFIDKNDIDMVAMATHGFKGLTHLFLGSIAEDIVNHAKMPVWTFSLKGIN
jgi:nucleotide-binding universal stress UspA family protein